MTQNIGCMSADVLYATYNYASSPAAGGTDVTPDTGGNTHGWLYVGDFSELDIDIVVTFVGGVSPTLTLNVDRGFGNDVGAVQPTYASNVATAAAVASGTTTPFTVGAGLAANKGFGRFVRVAWTTLAGGATALTIVVSVVGKAL